MKRRRNLRRRYRWPDTLALRHIERGPAFPFRNDRIGMEIKFPINLAKEELLEPDTFMAHAELSVRRTDELCAEA